MLKTDDNKFLLDCNGVKTVFEFGFKLLKIEDLKVSLVDKITNEETPQTLNVDYTVEISRIQDGGKVIFNSAPASTYRAFGYREVEILQPEEIPTEGGFPEKTLENALDRSCMINQQLKEEIDRCMKTPAFAGIETIDIEIPSDGMALVWDVDGTKATIKNSSNNPDNVVAECQSLVVDCQAEVTLASAQADRSEAAAEVASAIIGSVPTSVNVTQWARLDDGAIHNLPLPDMRAEKRPYLSVTDKRKIKVYANTFIKLVLADSTVKYLAQLADIELNVESILDSGTTLQAGKDYYLYLVNKSDNTLGFVVSLNSTYPTGYDANTSRKIGGFHTLCVSVTSANAPRAGHPAIGYSAGDIIPNSIWALNFKAASGNEGKAYIAPRREWQYIYNVSGTGASTKSAYGATRSHTRNYHKFVDDLFNVGDMLITQDGFSCGMEGSNYLTAVAGAAQPNPDTTGGRLDTAGKRMISNYFLEEGCGLQWQFAEGLIGGGGSAWSAPDADGKGQQYGTSFVVILGGNWINGGYSGPRCRCFDASASTANADLGGRGRSCHIEF